MKNKRLIPYLLILAFIPAVIVLSALFLPGKFAVGVSVFAAAIACVAFAFTFEKGNHTIAKIVLAAVMVSLSVAGRLIFAAIPAFKPVTAIVVLTGMYFGAESGFLTGAMTALLSNIYFGQGPWTPFQMLTWGIIGFAAGLLANPLRRSRILLVIYGMAAGVAYSLLMDVFSVMWADGVADFTVFLALFVSSLPFMAIYAASNAVFLFLLAKPFDRKAQRIITKYGI